MNENFSRFEKRTRRLPPVAMFCLLFVKSKQREFPLRLADVKQIEITPYRTGFKTGIKIRLSGWRSPVSRMGSPLGLKRRMAALHERLALLEMTNHEFLDANYRRERSTFADGTVVTVDWDAQTATVTP